MKNGENRTPASFVYNTFLVIILVVTAVSLVALWLVSLVVEKGG